jgi:tissue factor pathway inhibitor
MGGSWKVFLDGNDFCASVACSALPKVGPCQAIFPRFYFDPARNTCTPFDYGGCEGNANNYVSLEDCEETCTRGDDPVAVIAAPSCEGYGEQVSGPGTPEFTTEGFTVSRSESWGCGCATRPEFVMTYQINGEQKIELRLCHDDKADSCEALCTQTLSYDLSGLPPTIAADFVFP